MSRARGLWPWIVAGVAVRVIVMPITFHPDLLFLEYFPSLFAFNGVLDVYSYTREHYAASMASAGWFYYPPLTYFTLGVTQWLAQPVLPGYQEWIGTVGAMVTGDGGTTADYLRVAPSPFLHRYLFVLKVPFLIADLAAGALLLRTAGDERARRWAFKAWMLNPVTIYSAFMAGRWEVIPAACMVASVVALQRFRGTPAALWIGIATAYNNLPALCIPAACFAGARTWVERLRRGLIAVIPYAVFFIPLYLSSDGFVRGVLVPPKYRGALEQAGGTLSLKAAAMTAIVACAYVAWIWRLRAVTTSRQQAGILAALCLAYLAYGWRFGIELPGLAAIGIAASLIALAERDVSIGIETALVVWVFDAASRFGLNVPLLALVYVFVLAHAYRHPDAASVWPTYYVIVLAAAFTMVSISFFWFVILTPFLALWAGGAPRLRVLCAVQVAALAVLTLHKSHLLGGLFAPLDPSYYTNLPGLPELLSPAALDATLRASRRCFHISSWLIVAAAMAQLLRTRPAPSGAFAN